MASRVLQALILLYLALMCPVTDAPSMCVLAGAAVSMLRPQDAAMWDDVAVAVMAAALPLPATLHCRFSACQFAVRDALSKLLVPTPVSMARITPLTDADEATVPRTTATYVLVPFRGSTLADAKSALVSGDTLPPTAVRAGHLQRFFHDASGGSGGC